MMMLMTKSDSNGDEEADDNDDGDATMLMTMISSISTTDVNRCVDEIMVRPLATFSSVRLRAASVV